MYIIGIIAQFVRQTVLKNTNFNSIYIVYNVVIMIPFASGKLLFGDIPTYGTEQIIIIFVDIISKYIYC